MRHIVRPFAKLLAHKPPIRRRMVHTPASGGDPPKRNNKEHVDDELQKLRSELDRMNALLEKRESPESERVEVANIVSITCIFCTLIYCIHK